MVVPWALTFPGVFTSLGLPDAGLQSTASIATLRRLGFPLFVLAYALLKNADPSVRNSQGSARRVILGSVVGVLTIACGLPWLIFTSDDQLPHFMSDPSNHSELSPSVPAPAALLFLPALLVIWPRRPPVRHPW